MKNFLITTAAVLALSNAAQAETYSYKCQA
jgi:hypothetical protein